MQKTFERIRHFSACSVTADYISKFIDFYESINYNREQEKPVSSGYDKSVYLIGSSISSLKPFLLENNIPSNGVFIVQPAIRTQQLKNLYRDDEYFSEWASFFIALGTLTNYDKLDRIVFDIYKYLLAIGMNDSDILIRVSSDDDDLVNSCSKVIPRVKTEVNTRPNHYYKHQYGMDIYGIGGRNMDIALKDYRTKEYADTGTVVVIEKNGEPIAVEATFGLSAIIARLFGCRHTVQATPVSDFWECADYDSCRFADCISVVTHLEFEGIYPNSTKMPGRLLKKYIQGVIWYTKKFGIELSHVMNVFNDYYNAQYKPFGNTNDVLDNIEKHIKKVASNKP